jgi:hypothetical protein
MPARERFRPSLRTQFILSFLIAGALIAALIVFVDNNQNDSNRALISPSAIAEQNREADLVIGQDQRPHVVDLAPGARAPAALQRAIAADMNRRIALGTIAGSLQRVACSPVSRRAPIVFDCAAYDADVRYLYVGVARGRALVYCRKELPPVPGEHVPLSPRCT